MERDVELRLSSDEALVLFDWVHRMEDEDYANVSTAHKGELAALLGLSGALERTLAEPFRPDYLRLVGAARERLRLHAFGDEDGK